MACNDLISDTQIKNIYKDGHLIATNDVVSICNETDLKKSQVQIYDGAEICMLQRPIERSYFRVKELFSDTSASGKVVKHEYFILKDDFQGKKIVTNIHPKEMDTYRMCEFKEIQLDAAWDGLVVWKKMFFKFKNAKEENFIKIAIQRYLRDVKGMSLEEIGKVIKSDPFSIAPSYLKDNENSDNDFRHWVSQMFGRQVVIRMYKEVA